MPIKMNGKGRKNESGLATVEVEEQQDEYTLTNETDNLYTITFDFIDNDEIEGGSIDIPYNELYSMTFALGEEHVGGIIGVEIQRLEDVPIEGRNGADFQYQYRAVLTVNRDSSQRSFTIGGPDPLDELDPSEDVPFVFSQLQIGRGALISTNNIVEGTPDADCLTGNVSVMRGGTGNDTYIVSNSNTLIDEAPRTGIETVISEVNWYLNRRVQSGAEMTGTGLDNLILARDAVMGIGNELPNTIKGNKVGNVLDGKDGNDTLSGEEGDDNLVGGLGNDTLFGASDLFFSNGDDLLNGFGTVASAVPQIDKLIGSGGADTFVLGGTWGVSYVEEGDGYALIADWGAFAQDKIQVQYVPKGEYSIGSRRVDGIGENQEDTEIFFTDANGSTDRIAIVKDTTNVDIARDFVFVTLNGESLLGGVQSENLVGTAGDDELNGFGTNTSAASQIDTLRGGGGSDTFVLGGSWGVSYVEVGDGYAVIKDWDVNQDYIQVKTVSGGAYSLDKSRNVIGSGANDTEIYFTDSDDNRDRIGIVEDTTNVQIGRDFLFV